LQGGVPETDIESLSPYWKTFPHLKDELFKQARKGFEKPLIARAAISDSIDNDSDFSAYADKVEKAFEGWKNGVNAKLLTDRVTELAERYEKPLPVIEKEAADYEDKVKAHLKQMGYAW
jgi:hypothetical protein